MPPRSYYIEPRIDDYVAFAEAFFPEERDQCRAFADANGVPYIENESHLAAYIGVSPLLIRQIRHNPRYHYRTFPLERPGREPRIINTPKTYLKVVQWWILDNILKRFEHGEFVHGFLKGKGYVSNAKSHIGCKHILNVDIENFFPSITKEMIRNIFLKFGYGRGAALLLAHLISLRGEAPIGAPTSPSVGNIVLSKFDQEVSELAAARNIKYTRYADDLTFSSMDWIEEEFLKEVNQRVQAHNFKLNDKKTRFMGRGDRMEITGVVINAGPNAPRQWRNKVRGILHRARMNPDQFVERYQLISGIYGTLVSLDPIQEKKITKTAYEVLELLKDYKAG